jgi:hypothetical protein
MSQTPDGLHEPISGGNEKSFGNQHKSLTPFILESGRNIDQLYEDLKRHEARPADRDELIKIVRLSPSQPEFNHMLSVGVKSSALDAGRVTRGVLLDAGYVFLNRIGGGEKPLVNAQIPMAVEGRVETVDIGKKILLTQDELEAVTQYQSSQLGASAIENSNPNILRKDMLLFLQEAIVEQNNLAHNKSAAFRAAQGRIIDNPKYTDEDRKTLRQFFAKQSEEYQRTGSSRLGYLMEECIPGIDLIKVRGIPFEILPTRFSALRDIPSPFLDSGFHFDTNYDVTLYPHEPDRARRLNMVVVHLLSRGLSEMGKSINNSHDQHYISAGEYEKQIYKKMITSNNVMSDADLDIIAYRLLTRADRFNKQSSNKI